MEDNSQKILDELYQRAEGLTKYYKYGVMLPGELLERRLSLLQEAREELEGKLPEEEVLKHLHLRKIQRRVIEPAISYPISKEGRYKISKVDGCEKILESKDPTMESFELTYEVDYEKVPVLFEPEDVTDFGSGLQVIGFGSWPGYGGGATLVIHTKDGKVVDATAQQSAEMMMDDSVWSAFSTEGKLIEDYDNADFPAYETGEDDDE